LYSVLLSNLKKMKTHHYNYSLLIIIVLLVASNVFILYNFINLKKSCGADITKSLTDLSNMKAFKVYEFIYNNQVITDTLVKNKDNKDISLRSLITADHLIALHISENNCQECVEDELSHLADKQAMIPVENFIIFAHYKNHDQILKLLEKHKTNIRLFFNKNLLLPVLEKEHDYPFYMQIDKSLKISNLYFPSPKVKVITEEYYKHVFPKK